MQTCTKDCGKHTLRICLAFTLALLQVEIATGQDLPTWTTEELRGSPAHVTWYKTGADDTAGEHRDRIMEYRFDSLGRVIELAFNLGADQSMKGFYEYHSGECRMRWADGESFASRTRIQLDTGGRAISWVIVQDNGTFLGRELCERDSAGRLITYTKFQQDSSLEAGWKYEYDEAGRLSNRFTLDGSLTTITERIAYTYDSLGFVAREEYSKPGELRDRAIIKFYERDSLGNVISEGLSEDGSKPPQWHTRFTYTYDTAGNWTTRRSMRMEPEGTLTKWVSGEVWARVIEYY